MGVSPMISHMMLLIAMLTTLRATATDMLKATGHIGGVPVYNFNPDDVSVMSSSSGKMEWVLVAKDAVDDKHLHAVCMEAPNCIAEGHPDEGGIGFATVRATAKELEKLVSAHKLELEYIEPSMPVEAFPLEEVTSDVDDNLSLGQTPQVDPFFWNLDRIDSASGLDGRFSPKGDGKGVHVYVLDTGIRTTHEEFGGRAIPTLDVTSGRLKLCRPTDVNCANDLRNGHGTHVAATIGGKRSGVAKASTLHAVKVIGHRGGSTGAIISAMDWILEKGERPAVMSLSLGGRGQSQTWATAVNKAYHRGVTVVVAAGNQNRDACGFSPAYVPTAITVGATNKTMRRAGFSNWGKCLDIHAPGVNIMSAFKESDGSYKTLSGTSMACPAVTGAVALLLQQKPHMKPSEVASLLKGKAVKRRISGLPVGTPNLHLVVETGSSSPSPGRARPINPVRPPAPPAMRRRRRRFVIASSRRRRYQRLARKEADAPFDEEEEEEEEEANRGRRRRRSQEEEEEEEEEEEATEKPTAKPKPKPTPKNGKAICKRWCYGGEHKKLSWSMKCLWRRCSTCAECPESAAKAWR